MKVILIMAVSMDGKIALHSKHAANWTSKEDKKHFIEFTKQCGCLIMGRETFSTIGRPLHGRLNLIFTRSPEKFKNQPGLLEFTNQSPESVLEDIKTRGFNQVALCGGTKINNLFLKKNLIDEIHLTIEPILFGKGMGLFDLDINPLKLKLLDTEKINHHTFTCKYQILKTI